MGAWAKELHHFLCQTVEVHGGFFELNSGGIHARIVEDIVQKIEETGTALAYRGDIIGL